MVNNLEYKNKAEVQVHACGKDHTIYSNEVDVQKIVIRVEKTADKYCVFAGDCLEYTVLICNDSSVEINGTIFCDFLPTGLELEPNTFKVNSVYHNPTYTTFDNKISYTIDKIAAGAEVKITFTTKVL